MFRTRLLTQHGEFVAEADMPPFKVLPDVVAWGERVFKLDEESSEAAVRLGGAVAVYKEAKFFYPIPIVVQEPA